MSKFIIDKIDYEKNNSTLILGLAFKENCRDTRNSGVFDLIQRLNKKAIVPDVYDPLILNKPLSKLKYKFLKKLVKKNYKNIIIAVAHEQIKKIGLKKIKNLATNKKNVKVLDISSKFDRKNLFFQL